MSNLNQGNPVKRVLDRAEQPVVSLSMSPPVRLRVTVRVSLLTMAPGKVIHHCSQVFITFRMRGGLTEFDLNERWLNRMRPHPEHAQVIPSVGAADAKV